VKHNSVVDQNCKVIWTGLWTMWSENVW